MEGKGRQNLPGRLSQLKLAPTWQYDGGRGEAFNRTWWRGSVIAHTWLGWRSVWLIAGVKHDPLTFPSNQRAGIRVLRGR